MLKSSYRLVLAARSRSVRTAYVARASGWGGGYKRKPPSGYHVFMKPSDRALLAARLEAEA